MALPTLDAPAGSMLPGSSAHGDIATEMDDSGLAPEPSALLQSSARSGQPSLRYPNGELFAQLGDLQLISEVAAPPRDSTTRTEPIRSTRRRDGPSGEPDSTADRTVSRQLETSSSAVSSLQTSARPRPHGDTSDSESEDSGKTSKPSNSMPGPSANGNAKPSKQPEGSSTKKKLKAAGIVAGVAVVAGAAAVVAAPVALAAVGFTSSGVAAGSMAAAYQATLGGVIAKGSVFAVLQSCGAAGIPAAAQAMVAAGGATVGGGIAKVSQKFADWKQAKNSGKGTDRRGFSGGLNTGAKAKACKGANGEEGAKGTRKGSRLKNEKDNCTENGLEYDRKNVKSSDAEGQETCRQNQKNEEVAGKQRMPLKYHLQLRVQ